MSLHRLSGRFVKKNAASTRDARVSALVNSMDRHRNIRASIQTARHDHSYVQTEKTSCVPDFCPDEETIPCEWTKGRRVVNLYHISKQLSGGCCYCKNDLHLIDTVRETRKGLGSFLKIKCRRCENVTNVTTDTRHTCDENKKRHTWDINSKLAIGVIHSGLGLRNVNKLFTALNIPDIHPAMLKHREREVGLAIEKLAKASCQTATEQEVLRTTSSEPDLVNSVAVSFDGGWQKRGSGHCYNSLSGHASMIGKETGKLVAYDVRCKSCRICQAAKNINKEPRPHDCRKNWSGSAKAMEPDMCVSMLSGLKGSGISVGTLIMDDDSTCIARARTEVDGSIQKACDTNHLKKSFTSKLYTLAKRHKQLTSTVISHIGKCFMYAIKQNKDNSDKIGKNIRAISAHLFGDHTQCDSSWCGYCQSPDNYIPRHLPYRKYLTDSQLKVDLSGVLEQYAVNSVKLTKLGSSQRNESFNNTVATKNPKAKHYSASESTCFRVASAVAETNIGSTYLTEVNNVLLLSPGEHTAQAAERTDLKRKARAALQCTTAFKRQRVMLKDSSRKETASKEVREGITYQPGVNLTAYSDDHCRGIPDPCSEPSSEPIPTGEYEEVVFDLETTGLGLSDIVQLAAVSSSGEECFNRYVIPSKPMTLDAAKITGMSVHNGDVYKNGIRMDSVSTDQCLNDFTQWLRTFKKPVVLIAHNSNFDSSVLINSCSAIILKQLHEIVTGFFDTLKLFRLVYPQTKSHKLETLVTQVLGTTLQARDALEDCRNLCHLYRHVMTESSKTMNDYLKFTCSLNCVTLELHHSKLTSKNLYTLQDMVNKAVLTNFMARKVASSGLDLRSLQLAYQRDNVNGIKSVFVENTNGHVRVTKCKRIIQKCSEYFSQTT